MHRFFRRLPLLAGLLGTALPAGAEDLSAIYRIRTRMVGVGSGVK